ncbi:MAG: TolC family protein [Pseudohongiella sp.]|nr:TolC family protein [Pseudohongiella sp.]
MQASLYFSGTLKVGALLKPLCLKRVGLNRVVLKRVAFKHASLLVAISLLSSCTAAWNQQAADKASYALIEEKSSLVPGMSTNDIIVDSPRLMTLDQYPSNTATFDFLGNLANSENGAHIINLEQALDLAFALNKDYQLQRERLYLQALSLTADRYRYTPIFSASANSSYAWDTRLSEDTTDTFAQDADALISLPASAVATDERLRTDATLGTRLLLRGGGQIALNLTSNFLKFVTGDLDSTASSALVGSFTQPLLRGAGSDIAAETLMQAERDLLYQLREFTRYRQTLAVRIATQYYTVLEARDTVRNNFAGLSATLSSLERERAFQAEGLRTPGQVGRLEQSSLQRDRAWALAITRYANALDSFKILLGLRADARLMLDDQEMLRMSEGNLVPPDITLEQALELTVNNRLDLFTQADRIADRARKLDVAANAFKPGLAMVLRASVPANSNNSATLSDLDFRLTDYSAGLELDIPVDQMSERTAYRRALIDYEVAVRAYESAVDNAKLGVLDAWRALEQAERNYEISMASVRINERRVEEAELRAELGTGNIQDTVDAQNDLINSRTQLTSAIIDHNVAKLALWRDVGLLSVSDNGRWQEGAVEQTDPTNNNPTPL